MRAVRRHFGTPFVGQETDESGFTLVELLAVMAIALIVFGFTIGTFGGAGSLRCKAASKSAATLFAEARQWAVSTGSTVRLLVHQDPSEPERIGRFLALVRSAPVSPPEGTGAGATGNLWFPGNTMHFDEGIYFSTGDVGTENPPEPFRTTLDVEGSTGGVGTLWTSFVFSPRGVCLQEGSHFVFRPGLYEGGVPVRQNEKDFSGFTIQRSGKALFFTASEPLPNPPGP